MTRKHNKISIFTLVMINVIAIDSLRSIAINAQYGSSILFYYTIAALGFFIPAALVAAELASTWPQNGGLYLWIKQAFGVRIGFLIVWIQWIYNICWYPTILSLLAATLAYIIDPKLADHKIFTLLVINCSYWLTTFVNNRGIVLSGLLSSISAIIGTILPMLIIIALGFLWYANNLQLHVDLSLHAILPNLYDRDHLILISSILYSLIGIEMSAYHAQDVKNPQRDYPRALLYSTVLILVTMVGSSLAVAAIVPQAILHQSLIDGLLEAFKNFFAAFHMPWATPILAVLIIIGILGGVGAWIIGPSKGMRAASLDINMPKIFSYSNQHGAPSGILLVQGLVTSFLSCTFILMPTVNSAFFILSNLTAQLALVGYIFMFAAAYRLRITHPTIKRPYKVPGNNCVMLLICASGIITSAIAIMLTFLPPQNIRVGSLLQYMAMLILGFILVIILPFFMLLKDKTQHNV